MKVLVFGRLANSAVLVRCIVRAIIITIPRLNVTEYVKADVVLAPPYLPDGEYELHFDGRMMIVKNADGHWSSEDLRGSAHGEQLL